MTTNTPIRGRFDLLADITRAADVWHEDEPGNMTAGVLRREAVRRGWPELGKALDAEPPTDILMVLQDEDDPPAELVADDDCECDDPVIVRWPSWLGMLASGLCGLSIGLGTTAYLVAR